MVVIKERVFTRADDIVFALLTCLSVAAILYFFARWFSLDDWLFHPASFLVLTAILFLRVANSLARWFTLPFMARPRTGAPKDGLKTAVVTTIVPGAESLEMLQETLRALVALSYPHDTWVLDEGDSEDVKAICQATGVVHFSRKDLPHYRTASGTFKDRSKHGNYNAWLHEIGFGRYEILAAFDPDHVPIPSFLTHVLGYFEDPAVGYVQAAQAYYNQGASFISRGAAEETYEYYSCTQMAAFGLGQPAVVGCHNTHRVAALEQVGGFAAHDADDLVIGLRYKAHGWRGVYVPRVLARGVTPVDWNGYLTQQLRWARSVIDVNVRLPRLLGKELPPAGRALSAAHCLFYVQNSVTTLAGLLVLAYMLVSADVPRVVSAGTLSSLAVMCAALQASVFYRQRFYLRPRGEWGTHWRAALLRYAKWPVFILAMSDVALGRRVPYALTQKVLAESRPYLLLVPHTIVVVFVSAAWAAGARVGRSVPFLLYGVAAAVIAASCLLILTSLIRFPEPYQKRLLPSSKFGGDAVS
jgi:cellulose synthase (UDP-forming)